MFGLAWSTFRARWPLFIGAIATTAFAVAVTQASLLALVAAATADVASSLPEPARLALDNWYSAAVTLLSLVVGVAFFVSIFVVASTWSFAVAQRRTDFALLRLLGASRRQVRRLMLRESLLLGVVATALGIPLGVGVTALQDHVLTELGFVPEGFRTPWRSWVIAVSAGVGIVVTSLSARVAARRASRIRPLESLRGSPSTDRVMTASRWVIGALGLAGAIAMVSVAPFVGAEAAAALAINTCFVLVVALSAWSPIIIPIVAALVAHLARRGPLADLVGGNLRTAVRRTAATAAPVIVLCGLVVGVSGTFAIIGEATRREALAINTSTIVAASDRAISPVIASAPGVGCWSEEVDAVAHVQAADFDDEPLADTPVAALAIDPVPYLCTHRIDGVRGDLTLLTGATIALDARLAARMRVGLTDMTSIIIAGRPHRVRVVAIVAPTLGVLPELWLPSALIGDAAPATGDHHAEVVTVDDAATETVLVALASAGIEAGPTSDWVSSSISTNDRQNRNIQLALVGLAALFTLLAIANAVVNALASRREELATLRLVGLTRSQVIRMALWESAATLVTGVALGLLAASGPILAVRHALSRSIGTTVMAWPWQGVGLVTSISAVLIALSTTFTALAVTSTSAVTCAGARE